MIGGFRTGVAGAAASRPTRRLLALLLLAALLAPLLPGGSAEARASGDGSDAPAGRVLVVSLPRLTWERLDSVDTPRMDEFLAEAALASASTRTVGARTTPGDAYLTIGAGNRTTAAGLLDMGAVFDAEEATEEGTAAEVYQRRMGTEPTGEVLSLEWAQVETRNDQLLYGSTPGSLGQALEDAGMAFASIANADDGFTADPRRQGALALLDGDGQAPLGEVGPSLLIADPLAPGGVRMDAEVVTSAATTALDAGAEVLLVEMSDLERAEQSRTVSSEEAADRAYEDALVAADAMFGRLTALAGGPEDLVLLVAPTAPLAQEELTVFAIRSPRTEAGWARSSTTRRDGYVSLTDIAATVTDFLGLETGEGMSETPVTTAADPAVLSEKVGELVRANDRAVFRDDVVGPLTVAFIVLLVLMLVLVAAALRWGPGPSGWLGYLALVVMTIPAVTYLGGLLPYSAFSTYTYGLVLLAMAAAVSAVFVALARGVGRGEQQVAPVLVGAFTVAVLAIDVLTGGHLQLDTIFGYSPIVAGRFSGFGNQAFSLISVSALLVACGGWIIAERRSHTRVRLGATLVLFALIVIVVGAPTLGSDVGGVLASVPAFAVCVLLLTGRRIRVRTVAVIGVATVAVLAVFAAIDMARPSESRTHLGRFAQRIVDGDAALILERKLNANLSVLTTTVWTWVIPAALLFLVYLTWRPNNVLRRINEAQPSFRAFGISAITLGLVAWALNDSGVSMPAMMLAVALPYTAVLAIGVLDDRRSTP